MEYLEGLMIAMGVIGMLIAGLLLYVGYKVEWDLGKFKAHWTTDGKGAASGIVVATLVFILLSFVAYEANATEPKYLNGTTVFAGIDRTSKVSPMCEENDIDDRLTSNIGVRQNLITYKDLDVAGQYTHHSCAIGGDAKGYDGVGISLQWTFGKK